MNKNLLGSCYVLEKLNTLFCCRGRSYLAGCPAKRLMSGIILDQFLSTCKRVAAAHYGETTAPAEIPLTPENLRSAADCQTLDPLHAVSILGLEKRKSSFGKEPMEGFSQLRFK
jgi:hypothetical protein